ncbi:MAG: PDZ domain-containing protein [Phycisphaerales bacterium]|nr:PDZ domain-containing protein [Phycisphaerales bacterium]
MRTRTVHVVMTLLVAALTVSAIGAPVPVPGRDEIFRSFFAREFTKAAMQIDRFLEANPNDHLMMYNGACARAQLGRLDEAGAYLLRAVKAGFRDFDEMRRDPDLAPMHGHDVYEAILEAAARVGNAPAPGRGRGGDAASARAVWAHEFGTETYRYVEDTDRHLVYAIALDDVSFLEMRTMLEREADHLESTLFGGPPSYEVLIAIPTPADAERLFDHPRVGGIYEHSKRRLIARNIGGSLRHEFFHLMHYGHMERVHQRHALWIQEGMASLYEDYEFTPAGAIRFLANERHNVVRQEAADGSLPRWDALFAMSEDRFMVRATSLYPMARSIFRFVADEGLLETWYGRYVTNFGIDPTGRVAFEEAFGTSIDEVERKWRAWVRRQPLVDTVIARNDGALGVTLAAAQSNDGIVIARVLERSGAAEAGLTSGDIIVAIDDRSTRSPNELLTIIAAHRAGDTVRVRIRRGMDYRDIPVQLRAVGR